MIVYKCKMCGGNLNVEEGAKTAICEYCQTQQTVPTADDEKKANLYNRANHFRQNGEFDKAMSIYEHILDEDEKDAEAYWSIVLCRYGIEYVEEPGGMERKPTVNRVQSQSILQDADYLMVLEYADYSQKVLYEQEANAINDIQKEILQIASKEKPYDIFLSYKEKAPDGQRTKTSVLAQDLYHHLSKEGYRVFFSKISLEDKVGQKYEPYIYSALNSAKVMLVVGMDRAEFMAPWVKNEWTRFINMIKDDPEKVLIPCFRDMNIDELPDEFQILQSQDLGRIGAEQDLLHGLSKIFHKQEEQQKSFRAVEKDNSKTEHSAHRLLQNAETYIRLKDYEKAKGVYQKITELYPEDYRGWWGLIQSESLAVEVKEEEFTLELEERWEKWFSYVKELVPEDMYEQKIHDWLVVQRKLSADKAYSEMKFLLERSYEGGKTSDSLIHQCYVLEKKIKERKNGIQTQKEQLEKDKPVANEKCREMEKRMRYAKIMEYVGWTVFVTTLIAGVIIFVKGLMAFNEGTATKEMMVQGLATVIGGGVLGLVFAGGGAFTPTDELKSNVAALEEEVRKRESNLYNDQQTAEKEIQSWQQEYDVLHQRELQETEFVSWVKYYLSKDLREIADLAFTRYCTEKGYDYQGFAMENESLNSVREKVFQSLEKITEDGTINEELNKHAEL